MAHAAGTRIGSPGRSDANPPERFRRLFRLSCARRTMSCRAVWLRPKKRKREAFVSPGRTTKYSARPRRISGSIREKSMSPRAVARMKSRLTTRCPGRASCAVRCEIRSFMFLFVCPRTISMCVLLSDDAQAP